MSDRHEESAASRVLGVDFAGLGDDPVSEVLLYEGADSQVELVQRLRCEVGTAVESIASMVDGCDAFDVIELLRLREFPLSPELGTEPGYDGSGAVIELIALVLLARGTRMATPASREESRPSEVIPDLHDCAKRLIRISSYRGLFAARLSDRGVLARLAAEYQSFFVSVRNHQYQSVQESHDAALFNRADTDELLSAHLGFTYGEFVAVRDAIQRRYSSTMTDLRDRTADVILSTQVEGRDPTDSERDNFMQAMVDLMFLPGERASFTVNDIALSTGLGADKVEVVLAAFSSDFDSDDDPVDAVMDFLRGQNPLIPANLIREGASHIMTTGPIGADAFRSAAEAALKSDQQAWTRYDKKIRSVVSEGIAADSVARLLGVQPLAAPLFYVAPKAGDDAAAVDDRCADPLRTGDLVEGDALFVVGDVAICVEVKGRTIADAARRGDLGRLAQEAKNIFGEGADQARRLESLIRSNGGLWRKDATWLDLRAVREIHTIVVGLDTFGPLAVSLGDLDAASLLGDGTLPWITSLHDLDVISRVVARPAEFLLYLRRRTDSGVATNYRGVDELDLFMLFMGGSLYVEPDPEEVHRTHTRTPPPRSGDRRRHLEQARPTIVGTYTDDLDRWMYWAEGSSRCEASKPVFNSHESADEIVDMLHEEQAPGWLRFGADLLGLSGETQQRLGAAIDQLIDQTRSDGGYHTLVEGFAGNFGYPTFFAACAPATMPTLEATSHLGRYISAKKHQVRSDRSLGLLFGDRHQVLAGLYLNDLPSDNADLDELGELIGLQHTWKARTSRKPANKVRRQRKKAKKRKRRR